MVECGFSLKAIRGLQAARGLQLIVLKLYPEKQEAKVDTGFGADFFSALLA